jgi:hypothetical protein
MHTRYAHLAYEAKGDAWYRGVSPFLTLHAQKRYLTIYSPHGPPTPANGWHAMGTREPHALRGVGGSRGSQAVRDLWMSRKSWD